MRWIPIQPFWILVAALGLTARNAASTPQEACGPTAVRAQVEVPAGKVSLADLLAPGTCSRFLRSAALMHLGDAPLVGSPRVLEGTQVRALLGRLEAEQGIREPSIRVPSIRVPERVTIRRAVRHENCLELAVRLAMVSGRRARGSDHQTGDQTDVQPGDQSDDQTDVKTRFAGLECGAAGRIAEDAVLEPARKKWNAGLETWDVSVECVHSGECVPFLVRVPERRFQDAASISDHRKLGAKPRLGRLTSSGLAGASSQAVAVRRGQKVSLVWEASGIRATVPAISLDAGALGESVRVRVEPSGLILRAMVTDRGQVRAGS